MQGYYSKLPGKLVQPFYLTVQLILKLADHLNCVTISHTLDSYSLSRVFYFAVVFFFLMMPVFLEGILRSGFTSCFWLIIIQSPLLAVM